MSATSPMSEIASTGGATDKYYYLLITSAIYPLKIG
jgi:hypothetical protein